MKGIPRSIAHAVCKVFGIKRSVFLVGRVCNPDLGLSTQTFDEIWTHPMQVRSLVP